MKDLSRELAELVARGLVVRHETPTGDVFGVDPAVAAQIADWMAAHPEERRGATDEQISVSLGRAYAASFEKLADDSEPEALDQAAEEAQHALQALLQGQAFGELSAFAGRLVNGSRDPELLGQVIDDFTASGVQVVFAEYRLRRLLGVGSSSAVYEAERVDNALPVAVKVLRGQWTDAEDDVLRFLDDARLANRVRHPNVVEVFDAGHMEGTRFLVMELLRGRSLERRWRAKGRRLPLKRVLEIAMHVLGVLAAAHEKSILHGAIKPSNIFITSEGGVKVLDFGIENLLRFAPPRRRFPDEPEPPSFLAPEQIRGELPDPRTDLWSVGSTMLALLSGRPADPHRPLPITADLSDVPPDVAAVIERALRPSRDERWPTAQQMWEAIAGIHAALSEPVESVSDPGPGTAPLVQTHPAGPLSERVHFDGETEKPSRSIRPAAGEPAPAQSSRSISVLPPPPTVTPVPQPPPPPELLPPVVPVPTLPDEPTPSRRRAVEHSEASRYLVPVTRRPGRWSLLLLIAAPVLILASLITVLWLSLIDRTSVTADKVDAAGPVSSSPVYVGPPSCSDRIRNNTETDVDCGGQCPPCSVQQACRAASDCRSFVCASGTCRACGRPEDCPRGMACRAGACVWVSSASDAGPSEPARDASSDTSMDASTDASVSTEQLEDAGPSSGSKKNGEKCAVMNECQSGFCIDGVCCNSACTGTCVACNLRTFIGMCAEIPFGYDPDKECGLKVCDGDGACGDRKINGKRCKTGRECKSGFCSKGICCNTECRGADANCMTGSCKRSLLIE
ncbi:MAG: protein kinase [Polyangiaceae bacterium]|nr:protein kinase [Polyangiaceae bacterium]